MRFARRSTPTGARSAVAIRRSNSSDTRYLLQDCPQARERALHSHLERGLPRARDPGHLLVGEIVRELQHDRFTLLDRKLRQRTFQLWPGAIAGMSVDCEIHRERIDVGEDRVATT